MFLWYIIIDYYRLQSSSIWGIKYKRRPISYFMKIIVNDFITLSYCLVQYNKVSYHMIKYCIVISTIWYCIIWYIVIIYHAIQYDMILYHIWYFWYNINLYHMWYGIKQYNTILYIWYDTVLHSYDIASYHNASYDTRQYCIVWYNIVLVHMIQYCFIWYNMIQ